MVQRFLAINDVPAVDVRGAFARVTEEARHRGIRPVETFYATDRSRAYTYVEADSEQHVRDAFAAAGLPVADVTSCERIFTDLLDEPHRSR
jgi:hypothetical protein